MKKITIEIEDDELADEFVTIFSECMEQHFWEVVEAWFTNEPYNNFNRPDEQISYDYSKHRIIMTKGIPRNDEN